MRVANTSISLERVDLEALNTRTSTLNQRNTEKHGIPSDGLKAMHADRKTKSFSQIENRLNQVFAKFVSDDYELVSVNPQNGDDYQGPIPVIIGEVHLNDRSQQLHNNLGEALYLAYTDDPVFDTDLLIEGCSSYQGKTRHGFENKVFQEINQVSARAIESFSDYFDFLIADLLRNEAMENIYNFNAELQPAQRAELEFRAQGHQATKQRDISIIAKWLFNSGEECPLDFEERAELIKACNQRYVQRLIDLAPGVENILENKTYSSDQIKFSLLGFKDPGFNQYTNQILTTSAGITEEFWNRRHNQRDKGMANEIQRAGNHCFPVKVGMLHFHGISKNLKEANIPHFILKPKDIESFAEKYRT